MNPRNVWLAVMLAGWALLLLACAGENPRVVQTKVEQIPPDKVVQLTPSEANRLFQLQGDANAQLPWGTVYNVSGTIKQVTIREATEKRDELYEIRVVMPEYAAGVVVCRFSQDHKTILSQRKVGETVIVRGMLENRWHTDNELDLNGCIFK